MLSSAASPVNLASDLEMQKCGRTGFAKPLLEAALESFLDFVLTMLRFLLLLAVRLALRNLVYTNLLLHNLISDPVQAGGARRAVHIDVETILDTPGRLTDARLQARGR